jgi:hypothetical protein
LAEVVGACVEAGAVSISTVALHLRPGVREHYLSWLRTARPELVEETERRYQRAYLPAREQEELTDRVRHLVESARGTMMAPRASITERVRAHMGGDRRPAEVSGLAEGSGPAAAQQLRLDLETAYSGSEER